MRVLERLDELYAIGGGPGANRPHLSAAEDEAHRLAASWLRGGRARGRGRSARQPLRACPGWAGSAVTSVVGLASRHRSAGRSLRRRARRRRRDRGRRACRCRLRRRLSRRGGRLHRKPGARRRGWPLAEGVSRAPRRAGPGARRREMRRSASSPGSSATRAESSSSRDAPDTRARRRWRVATTRSSRRPARSSASAMRRSASRAPSRRSGSSTSSRAARTSSRHACRMSLDVRAPDVERLDALIAEIGFEPGYRVEPAQFAGTAAAGASRCDRGAWACRSSSSRRAPVTTRASSPRRASTPAMLFVRSLNGGVSHSPDELSSDEDVALAVDVLADALAAMTR